MKFRFLKISLLLSLLLGCQLENLINEEPVYILDLYFPQFLDQHQGLIIKLLVKKPYLYALTRDNGIITYQGAKRASLNFTLIGQSGRLKDKELNLPLELRDILYLDFPEKKYLAVLYSIAKTHSGVAFYDLEYPDRPLFFYKSEPKRYPFMDLVSFAELTDGTFLAIDRRQGLFHFSIDQNSLELEDVKLISTKKDIVTFKESEDYLFVIQKRKVSLLDKKDYKEKDTFEIHMGEITDIELLPERGKKSFLLATTMKGLSLVEKNLTWNMKFTYRLAGMISDIQRAGDYFFVADGVNTLLKFYINEEDKIILHAEMYNKGLNLESMNVRDENNVLVSFGNLGIQLITSSGGTLQQAIFAVRFKDANENLLDRLWNMKDLPIELLKEQNKLELGEMPPGEDYIDKPNESLYKVSELESESKEILQEGEETPVPDADKALESSLTGEKILPKDPKEVDIKEKSNENITIDKKEEIDSLEIPSDPLSK